MDGYTVYDLLDKLDGIMILCCWAHCRRCFDRALNHDRKWAEYGIEQIGLIYSVETIADEDYSRDLLEFEESHKTGFTDGLRFIFPSMEMIFSLF